ncbi:MAG TPA: MgtC/SapB family protein [candidate division Zixibacteria bacterium]|nr:MgtC/SapB family protein [candidate division Zixibacteria bacterium]HEQ97979.1 MgtC/SapB family protein [candidate division Zixibacteria bacterium]
MNDLALVLDVDVVIKMALAVLLGALIGVEREYHGRPAGLRTHILVCLGSTLLIIGSRSLPIAIEEDPGFIGNFVIDPARLAAGIITGIGFLGAGVVLKTKDFIRGVTTAACIWFAAAIGIVIGLGFYLIAVISTILALFVLLFLVKISSTIYPHTYKHIIIASRDTEMEKFAENCENILESYQVTILDTDYFRDKQGGEFTLDYYIRSRSQEIGLTLMQKFSGLPEVTQIRIN